MKLKWVHSYETIRFNTTDGDLDKGQYAIFKDQYLIRNHPKNNRQFVHVKELDTTNMEEVQILEGEHMYYDEFELPNGRRLRIPSSQNKYNKLKTVKKYPQPKRSVSDPDIQEITKEDNKWQ